MVANIFEFYKHKLRAAIIVSLKNKASKFISIIGFAQILTKIDKSVSKFWDKVIFQNMLFYYTYL